MKVSVNWLKEFVDFDMTPEELAKRLRSLGFDTASITTVGAGVSGVVTAKVESREKHPNADKLSLCQVFDGTTRFRVVCGAPNVAAGQTVPLARVGAKLPGGVEIKPAKIRGEESQGMLCSTRELGLGEEHAGILVLPEGTPLGEDANKTLMLNDAVLDVEVMPNRPDMLSHWGVAREIAASLGKPLRLPDAGVPAAPAASLADIQEKTLCGSYVARAFDGVKAGPAPLPMRLRLERCGVRSINNLVDATNYVMMELGHPLHVFDAEKLKGGKVSVRMSKPGESLACLDGATRKTDGCLVIADAAGPVAAAGVMGGAASGVTDATTRVLLESAWFQPSHVRQSRRRLNVTTESAYRFERGTDPAMAALASKRAAHLILKTAGGKMTGEQELRGDIPAAAPVRANPARVEALLGFHMPPADIQNSLERLGFSVKTDGADFVFTPPPHRRDVRETADIAEEAGRLAGFDRVPAVVRAAAQTLESPSAERRLLTEGREALAGFGFQEALNYGLAARSAWEALVGGPAEDVVELDNPLSLSGDIMAPSLLPLLLSNVGTNRRRGAENVRLFESARTFRSSGGQVAERLCLSFVAEGADGDGHWKFKPRPLEFWDAKAWVKSLLKGWRLPGVKFSGEGLPSFLHPTQAQTVSAGGKPAGFFGRLHPRRAEVLDLSKDTFVAELDLTALAAVPPLAVKHAGLAQHPALLRDFSLVFPETVSWSAVALFVMGQSEWMEDIRLFDVFRGDALPAGHRSLAFRASFRHPERTLTDAEAAKIQEKILEGLTREFKASLRG
jgi:phenylalanyl-tRNA synthetase beta chain